MPHFSWILYITAAFVPLAPVVSLQENVLSTYDDVSLTDFPLQWTGSSDGNSFSNKNESRISSIYSWLGSIVDRSALTLADHITENNDLHYESFNIEPPGDTNQVPPNRNGPTLPTNIAALENLIHPEQEVLDEVNDTELFQAVLTSLAQWNLQKIQRRKDSRRVKRDEETICYPDVGCFRDEGPFDYLDLLPSPPEEINTRFMLYSRGHDVPYLVAYNNLSSIHSSPFNASLPTKIMIHGFGSSCQRVWAKEMIRALIKIIGDVNVICVDWENGASLPNYVRAAVNTRLVGRQVGLLVNALNEASGSKNSDFHLIGFSLGAHVAGFAGSEVRNLSRITGLDPAGPLFENYDPRARLDSNDADLVDVIHSNGEKIYMGGLGAWAPMGDVDFYPNGGRMQKGCTNLFVGAVSDMIWSSAEENGRSLCNHRRAYKLFTDSIVPGCHFPAFSCETYDKLLEGDCFPCVDEKCATMGYYADRSPGRGIMYLATREEEPFCANQYRVQLHSTNNIQPITSLGKIELTMIDVNGFNETFSLTKGPDFELTSGGKLVRLVVPHPVFSPPTKVQLTYTAYHGWIYNGLPKWFIDKLILTDSFGKIVSYCLRGTLLETGKPVVVTLLPGDCNPINSAILLNGLPRHPFEPTLQASDNNEIPILESQAVPNSFGRSLDNTTSSFSTFVNSTTLEKISQSATVLSSISGSNSTNIYPYGHVPLSILQQHISADIKVSNRRPSFYQWPFVGASHAANFLFGNHGNQVRARLRSLGSSRKQEPQLQLTPPSQHNVIKDVPLFSSRRPYFRRNHPQPSAEDPSRAQYFLLRQQQLQLQQQQLHLQQQQLQQTRSLPLAATNLSPLNLQSIQGMTGTLMPILSSSQPLVPQSNSFVSHRGFLTQPNGAKWRPDAVGSGAPQSRIPNAIISIAKATLFDASLSHPIEPSQQSLVQTQVPTNPQHVELQTSVKLPVLGIATLGSAATLGIQPAYSLVAPSISMSNDELASTTPSLPVSIKPVPVSSPAPSAEIYNVAGNIPTTVATMTILNTPQYSTVSQTETLTDSPAVTQVVAVVPTSSVPIASPVVVVATTPSFSTFIATPLVVVMAASEVSTSRTMLIEEIASNSPISLISVSSNVSKVSDISTKSIMSEAIATTSLSPETAQLPPIPASPLTSTNVSTLEVIPLEVLSSIALKTEDSQPLVIPVSSSTTSQNSISKSSPVEGDSPNLLTSQTVLPSTLAFTSSLAPFEVSTFKSMSSNDPPSSTRITQAALLSSIPASSENPGLKPNVLEAGVLQSARTVTSHNLSDAIGPQVATLEPKLSLLNENSTTTLMVLNENIPFDQATTSEPTNITETSGLSRVVQLVNVADDERSMIGAGSIPVEWTYSTDTERPQASFVRSPFDTNGESDVQLSGLLSDEVYPNPEQLGQARDQYWAISRAKKPNGLAAVVGPTYSVPQQIFLTPPPPPPLQQSLHPPLHQLPQQQKQHQRREENRPRYIPLNPVARQNRKLRMQYYVGKPIDSIPSPL